MLRGTVCLFASLLALASGAMAQDWIRNVGAAPVPAAASPGSVSGRVRVGSASITLPPGSWTLAAGEVRSAASSLGGPLSERFAEQIYFQTERGVLASIVGISASVGYNANGWVVPRGCLRRDVFYVHNEGEYVSGFDCLRINHSVMRRARARTRSPLWQAAYDRITRATPLPEQMPEQMIVAEFDYLARNRGEVVHVAVFVNPETAGIRTPETAWNRSPWHKSNVDGQHQAYLDQVARWAEAYRGVVHAAWQ